MKVCIFSPHIDDAALSCGGLLSFLSKNESNSIHIINVFCGIYNDSNNLLVNIDRTFEERNLLNNGQITYFPIPDISQKLPVFSWDDVFMGKDELPDKDFINDLEKIEKDINKLIHMETYDLILFPMGYGDHKDHVMLSLLGRKYVGNNENIYFYRDIPYNNKGKWCDAVFSPVIDITFNLEHKIEIVKKYEKGLQVGDDILAEVINFHQSASECKETLYEYHIK